MTGGEDLTEILSYIAAHWLEWVLAICLAALTAAWRAVSAKLEIEHKKNEAIAEGVQSLLRESIVNNYNRCRISLSKNTPNLVSKGVPCSLYSGADFTSGLFDFVAR